MEITRSEVPPEDEQRDNEDEEAPWGRKADGTPRKKPGRRQGSTNTGGGGRKSLSSLQEPLADRLVEYFGPPIGMISPLAVAVLDDRAEKTAAGLLALAARRPRVRKMIDRLLEGSATADVGLTVVGMAVAIGVDHQRFDIEGKPSRYFKIDRLAEEVYSDTTAFYSANGNGAQARGVYGEVV